jgi:malate dehydrogenase
MTRLDQNRAVYQLAAKADVEVKEITNMTIWGNHSATQVPDFVNVKIKGKALQEVIHDRQWLEGEFVSAVQKRGAAIISARGKSSAASAASAAIDAMKSLLIPTPAGQWFSSAVYSANNPYGIDNHLIFSFPCRSKGDGDYQIVSDIPWNESLKMKIKASEKELIEERQLVQFSTINK